MARHGRIPGFRRVILLVFVSTASLIAGGSASEATRRCTALTQIEGKRGYKAIADGTLTPAQLQEVLAVCGRSYEETRRPSAGVAAARAEYHLRHDEQTLAWVEPLRGTSGEAEIWGVAANVYQRRGDRKQERAARDRVLALYQATNDRYNVGRSYYLLFLFATSEANLREQIEFLMLTYEEASKAEVSTPSRQVKDKCRVLKTMAMTYLVSPLVEIGDLNSARRALNAATALTPSDDRRALASLSVLKGITDMYDGQLSLAAASYKQALTLAANSDDTSLLRSIYLNLVETSVRAGNLPDAEAHLKSAWTHPDTRPQIKTSLLYYRALVARASGRYDEAKQTILTALKDPDADWSWQLEYELGRAQEGLGESGAVAAFSRSAALVEEVRRTLGFDEFKSWLLDQRRQPYEALFRSYARSGQGRNAVDVLERAKARTFLDAFVHSSSTTAGHADELDRLHESTERLDGLQALLPAMSQSTVAELRPLKSVLASVADKNVLMYFEAQDELWLVTLLSGRIELHALPQSAGEIRRLADQFLTSRDDVATAEKLGALLLPAAALPRPDATLYIVTDGSLGRLPFASLRPRGRVLVRDYTISYVPSLNALAAITNRAPHEYGPAVVLGDPKADLPAAARESKEVASRLGVAPFLGTAATRAQLAGAANARVLHLATHTGLGARGPWLAVAGENVTAAAIVTGATRPNLAVLATCASAAREGREMWGSLGAAFLAAGSNAVLASLWSIDDDGAREFITRFYDEGQTHDSAAALARTQRAFIDAGKPASFWAPYVHFGYSVIPHHR